MIDALVVWSHLAEGMWSRQSTLRPLWSRRLSENDLMSPRQASAATVVGGICLMIGSFMSWVVAPGFSQNGMTAGEGWATLASGVISAAAGMLSLAGRPIAQILPLLAVGVGSSISVYDYVTISEVAGYEVGIGMWIMLAGSVVALVALLMGRKKA